MTKRTSATVEPTRFPGTAAEKLERSREAFTRFLDLQNQWLGRAEDACEKGYFIETIGIAINQIHALLRRGLWLQSQNQSLEQNPKVWNDAYLFTLLQQPGHDMMEGAQDQQLYGAAMRFKVISADTASRLHRLYEEAKVTMRTMVSGDAKPKEHLGLRTIATELLEADTECLQDLQHRFGEFDQRLGESIAKM